MKTLITDGEYLVYAIVKRKLHLLTSISTKFSPNIRSNRHRGLSRNHHQHLIIACLFPREGAPYGASSLNNAYLKVKCTYRHEVSPSLFNPPSHVTRMTYKMCKWRPHTERELILRFR